MHAAWRRASSLTFHWLQTTSDFSVPSVSLKGRIVSTGLKSFRGVFFRKYTPPRSHVAVKEQLNAKMSLYSTVRTHRRLLVQLAGAHRIGDENMLWISVNGRGQPGRTPKQSNLTVNMLALSPSVRLYLSCGCFVFTVHCNYPVHWPLLTGPTLCIVLTRYQCDKHFRNFKWQQNLQPIHMEVI